MHKWKLSALKLVKDAPQPASVSARPGQKAFSALKILWEPHLEIES